MPLRMTCQRQIILEELRKVKTHPTADEVYQMVRQRLPRISLGTVYRNLEILSKSGMVLKLELGGSQRRFDGAVQSHYHVRCSRCGCVQDVVMQPVRDLEDKLRGQCDFEIVGHRLEFIGVCPACRSQNTVA
jgi:Fur family ferric uptake transcriptional regulator